MTRKLLLALPTVALLASIPSIAEAQGATCTGMCWFDHTGDVYCGFTALQEGGRCFVDYDQYGNKFCILYSCSGGGGWFPENQGLLPWLQDDGEREQVATIPRVTVRVVEPRS